MEVCICKVPVSTGPSSSDDPDHVPAPHLASSLSFHPQNQANHLRSLQASMTGRYHYPGVIQKRPSGAVGNEEWQRSKDHQRTRGKIHCFGVSTLSFSRVCLFANCFMSGKDQPNGPLQCRMPRRIFMLVLFILSSSNSMPRSNGPGAAIMYEILTCTYLPENNRHASMLSATKRFRRRRDTSHSYRRDQQVTLTWRGPDEVYRLK